MNLFSKDRAKWQVKMAELEAEEKALREAGRDAEAAALRMSQVSVREHLRRLRSMDGGGSSGMDGGMTAAAIALL